MERSYLIFKEITLKHMPSVEGNKKPVPLNSGTGFCANDISAWSTAEPYGPS